jgi:hypothetical protein
MLPQLFPGSEVKLGHLVVRLSYASAYRVHEVNGVYTISLTLRDPLQLPQGCVLP